MMVACEDDDGLLHIHPETTECEVCSNISQYLIIYHIKNGMAELQNVGIVEAVSNDHAIQLACKQWKTTPSNIYTTIIKGADDGWEYFS